MTEQAPEYQSPVEIQLLQELSHIDARLKELQDERRAVQRLLVRAQLNKEQSIVTGRRNSLERVHIEAKIVSVISQSKRPLSTGELYRQVSDASYGSINENTFRSYLHRLKKREIIAPHPQSPGCWIKI